MMRKCHVRFGGGRTEKVHTCTLSGSARMEPRQSPTLHHLGLPARRRLQTPARGDVDSGGVDGLARERPRRPRRRPVRRSRHAPARQRPGDSPRLATAVIDDGDDPARSAAEARVGGIRPRGAVRDESAFCLGLRARTDTTQPAHALAGRALRPRPRRQPPPRPRSTDRGSSSRADPASARLLLPIQLLTGRPRSTRPTARVACRAPDVGASAAPAPFHQRCRYA